MAKKLFYALPLVFICGGALCQLALAARDFGVADSKLQQGPALPAVSAIAACLGPIEEPAMDQKAA